MAVTKTQRVTKRTGNYPLAYMGVEPESPPNLTTDNRPPTPNDYAGFNVGDIWIDRNEAPDEDVWMLVNKDENVARWIMISGGALESLTADQPIPLEAVFGDDDENIFIHGTAPIVTTGNVGAWSLTISTDGTLATTYTTNAGNATPAAGVLNVLGGANAGTVGAGSTVTVNVVPDTIADTYTTNAGNAIPAAGVLKILGGELIGTIGGTNIVTVNLDRGTDGQVIIAATGATSAYANILSADNTITVTNTANAIDLAVTAPITGIGYYNIGLSVTAGPNTITIHSADGTAFSANNPGIVSFASKAIAGTFVRIQITANVTMAWTDMNSNTMGTTGGVAWADVLPFYVYAVLNAAETAVMFGLARMPHHTGSGITANIGTPAVANANSDLSMFLFDSVTIGDYDDNPVVLLGSLKVVKSAGDAWTFSAPVVGGDTGIGGFQAGTTWNIPPLQNGAQSMYLFANGGVGGVPVFASGHHYYYIAIDGTVTSDMVVNELTTAGTAGATIFVMLPLSGGARGMGVFCVGDDSVSVAAVRGVYRGLLLGTPLGGSGGHYGEQFVKNETRRLQCDDFDTLTVTPSQLTGSHSYLALNNRLP